MKQFAFGLLVVALLFAGACTSTGNPNGDGGDMNSNGVGNDDGNNDVGDDSTGDDSVNGEWVFSTRLEAFDPAGDDLYGDSVATSGDTIIVGTGAKNALYGIADIFIRFGGDWRFLQRLAGGPARFPEQGFGSAVAVGNNTAFVGAYKFAIEGSFAIQTGAVYVYTIAGPQYTQSQLLTINDADDFEYIGSALAYEENQSRLVVGAPGRDTNQGAAYVFTLGGGGYTLEQRLQASDGINFEDFGSALATENQTIIVGAPNQNSGTGAVYVYEKFVDWDEVQKIQAPDGAQTDKFGAALALEGNTLVIAAPSKQRPGDELLQAGYVYIYKKSGGTWTLQQTLIPDDNIAGLWGLSLALEDGTLAITAGGKQQVYFLEEDNDTWSAVDLVEPQRDTFVLDSYGNAISLHEGTLVIGARSANAGGSRAAGAAYVYSRGEDSGVDLPGGVRF
ncbi:MAG: hypothetical protein H6817_09985 [Phycisphaerales bacterium]|nr:hypothetical protein [Phycisphaerales bacterium]